MVLALPLLMNQSLENMLAFYLSVLIICQYLGSVMAIGVGIPGEVNSLPAVNEGPLIRQLGQTKQAIRFTAVGSLIGSAAAVVMLLIAWSFVGYSVYGWQTEIKLLLLVGTLIMLVLWSENKTAVNMLLLVFGIAMGAIGVNTTTNDVWTPFGIEFLTYGIPFLGVLIIVYVYPLLWSKHHASSAELADLGSHQNAYAGHGAGKFPWISSVRGSVIGFFSGFIPALSYSISSKLAWLVEKTLYPQTTYYDGVRRLVSAESANNAASLTAIIPLIMFGIPIVASETVLYNLISTKGFVLGPAALQPSLLTALATSYVLANLIGFIMAWPLAPVLTKIMLIHALKIKIVVSIMLAGLFFYDGFKSNLLDIYVVMAALLAVVALVLQRFNTQPVIFGFVLSPVIMQAVHVFVSKHF